MSPSSDSRHAALRRKDAAWDVVVVGSANTDYLVMGERLPKPGETLEGSYFQEASGGKGANQATAAARLGARVAVAANVGGDERGKEVIARLIAEGVDTRLVTTDRQAATGVALVLVNQDGEKAIMTALGANQRFSAADNEELANAIRSARVLLTQLEIPLAAVEEVIGIAHDAGTLVVLDPAPGRPVPDSLLAQVDVIRPNAREAEALTGVDVTDRGSARWAADLLLARGVSAVAVQAGAEGDLIVWHEGAQWLPKLSVRVVDATGAGDAFAAAMAVALAEGRPLWEAGSFANAAAALATTALGAQAALPSRAAVLELMELVHPREASAVQHD